MRILSRPIHDPIGMKLSMTNREQEDTSIKMLHVIRISHSYYGQGPTVLGRFRTTSMYAV